jgi:hypothetical protein
VPHASRIGEILVQAGILDEFQLETGLQESERFCGRLALTLVRLDLVEEDELVRALARKLGVPTARLDGKRIEPSVLGLVPQDLAARRACVPLFAKREGGVDVLYLGMEDPSDVDALDEVSFRAGLKVRPVLLAPSDLQRTLELGYGSAPASLAPSLPDEAPIRSEDTAPMLEVPPGLRSETPAPEPVADAVEAAGSGMGEEERCEGTRRGRAEREEAEIPTRKILHAITQLLIEKGVVTRAEVFERVSVLRTREEDDLPAGC